MQIINSIQCKEVAGGLNKQEVTLAACGVAFLIGGTAGAYVSSVMGPLTTFIGTPTAAIGLGAICTPFFPVVGTICCGFVGAVTGYYLSSSFATLGGGLCSGALSAAVMYYQLN